VTEFRTTFQIAPLRKKLSYGNSIFSIGSCFAENIGNRLIAHKYKTLLNPFGILYNPLSILHSLETIGDRRVYTSKDLVERDGLFHSFDHHGRFSAEGENQCLKNINSEIECASESLRDMDYLIITWGTAYAYRLKSSGTVVANCHKFPAADFDRELLNQETIFSAYSDYI